MTRRKKLAFNTLSGILFQITTIICGFILPRAILNVYGSEVNGLVNSVAQFLQIIAFLELGVGAVVQSSLYKPIVENDIHKMSEIVSAGNAFFKKIAYVLVLYVIVLMFIFPGIIDENHGFWYNALLILTMSISYFAQYYFGIVDRIFLNAAQKNYISNYVNIITLIINTIGCYILIYIGVSIQVVKLVTAIVFLFRPIFVRIYINKHYQLNRGVDYKKNAIGQKWNGIAQHMAAIVLDSTDTVILSIFSTLTNVSIYSVYNIVVSGVRQILSAATSGVMSVFGEFWAKQEKKLLNDFFEKSECLLHAATVFAWMCTIKLIVPFVLVYTKGVSDTNYNVPVFAILICLANAFCGLRLNYNYMILAANQYKQTQHIFIIAATINLVTSTIMVGRYGLIGVALGTIMAMLYQTLHMQFYCIKILGIYSYRKYCKQLFVDGIIIGVVIFITSRLNVQCFDWWTWIFLAVKEALIVFAVTVFVNVIFYWKIFKSLGINIIRKRKG